MHTMVWKKLTTKSKTVLLRGGIPEERMKDVYQTSKFASETGQSDGDHEYAYVQYCILFTTDKLLEVMERLKGG
jgi:hypothetical protein